MEMVCVFSLNRAISAWRVHVVMVQPLISLLMFIDHFLKQNLKKS